MALLLACACGSSSANDEAATAAEATGSTDASDTVVDDTGTSSSSTGTSATSEDGSEASSDDESSESGDVPEAPCAFAELRPVADVLATADAACVAWVESVYGRVARRGPGSAIVWTLHTSATTGVLLGARHSLGMSWSPGDEIAATLLDPNAVEGLLTLQHARADATVHDGLAPVFDVWIPELPAAESQSLADIRPRHDYYVAAIDDQLFEELKPFPFPAPLRHAPPAIVDPHGSASAEPTWAEAEPGASVLVLGHPAVADGMAVAVGTVMSDAEAEAAIAALQGAGDDEGAVPYDPEAEVVLAAVAEVGMSGGGVFDRDGRLVGISVRATLEGAPARYVRAVRASFIAQTTSAALDSAASELRDAIAPHLPQP